MRLKIIILTDGAPYYRASCRILNLRHGLYSIEVRNLMERIIELRIGLNYLITIYHALRMNAMRNMQILKSIMIMMNETWINRRVKAKNS